MKQKSIYKFVITGGPCGGKTEALPFLADYFSGKGYQVITVAETATELINSGIMPKSFDSIAKFQKHCISLQLSREDIYISAAQLFDLDVIILFDRGALDGKAYTTELQFNEILNQIGYSEQDILMRYDAIFHLVSAADGAETHYTTDNNSARTETLQEAIIADKHTLDAWNMHNKRYVIDNSTDFEDKIKRLTEKIEENLY